ncbi:carboxypeptidase-like regulatory domain-containing protein [Candidatus Woesearchaeota archaeon]|nr:carboxypeptidase-like regulatory domain-containing protein [Candidatus Woesearchaeota archaeon]
MGRNKTIIYILAFLVLISMVSAASITGTVQDQYGAPLPAVIRIVGTQVGTQADSQGRFSISSSTLSSGSHQIEVSMISYKTKIVTASTLRPTAVILEIEPIQQEETEVTVPLIKIKAQIQGDKFNRIYGTSNLQEVTNPDQELLISPQDTILFDASKTNKESQYFTWYVLNRRDYDLISTQSQQELLSSLVSFSKSTIQFKSSFTSGFEEGEHAVVLQLQDVENNRYYFEVIYIKSSSTIEPQIASTTTPVTQIQQPVIRQSSLISNLYCIQSIEPTVCNPDNKNECIANPFYNNSRFNNRVYINGQEQSMITGSAIKEESTTNKQNECIPDEPGKIKIYSCENPDGLVQDCPKGTLCKDGSCKKPVAYLGAKLKLKPGLQINADYVCSDSKTILYGGTYYYSKSSRSKPEYDYLNEEQECARAMSTHKQVIANEVPATEENLCSGLQESECKELYKTRGCAPIYSYYRGYLRCDQDAFNGIGPFDPSNPTVDILLQNEYAENGFGISDLNLFYFNFYETRRPAWIIEAEYEFKDGYKYFVKEDGKIKKVRLTYSSDQRPMSETIAESYVSFKGRDGYVTSYEETYHKSLVEANKMWDDLPLEVKRVFTDVTFADMPGYEFNPASESDREKLKKIEDIKKKYSKK